MGARKEDGVRRGWDAYSEKINAEQAKDAQKAGNSDNGQGEQR